MGPQSHLERKEMLGHILSSKLTKLISVLDGSVSGDGNPKWMSNLCDGYSALEFDQLFFEYQINVGDESQLKEWVEKKRAERRIRLEVCL